MKILKLKHLINYSTQGNVYGDGCNNYCREGADLPGLAFLFRTLTKKCEVKQT